jgi:hypothetical protein
VALGLGARGGVNRTGGPLHPAAIVANVASVRKATRGRALGRSCMSPHRSTRRLPPRVRTARHERIARRSIQ